MERDDKKTVSRLVLISGFIWLVFSTCFAIKLCYAFYESRMLFLSACFTLLSGLLLSNSITYVLERAAEENKGDKQDSKK
jgi:hypothetical protein